MNPAQLLNPKAFAKQSKKRAPNYGPQQTRKLPKSSTEEVKVNLPSYDPRTLLNPKAGAVRAAAETMSLNEGQTATPPNEQGEDDTDFSNIYEKHHNLKNREAPTLKRKSEITTLDDEEHKKQKTTFGDIGRGGILSEHLKKEREELARKSEPNSTVDLTADDDDDVIITAERDISNVEVCLGRLDVKAHCHRVPNISSTSNKIGKDFWPPSKVVLKRQTGVGNVIDLFDNTNKPFGRLESSAATGIAPLMDGANISKVRFKVFLKARKRKPEEIAGQSISEVLDLFMVLYAPRDKSNAIGKWLSTKQMFLGTPPTVEHGKELHNPHEMRPDYRPTSVINGTTKAPTVQGITYSMRTVEEKEAAVNKVFDNLAKTENIPEMDTDPSIISTALMPHQKQALHFMVVHELAESSDDSKASLWEVQNKGNRVIWHNIVTGQETTEQPTPTMGGILADMMGLGKTLSILALIATSQPQSKHFARSQLPKGLDRDGVNSRGTIIVCPKSVLSNWEEQVAAHTLPGKLKCYVYHGSTRTQDVQELSKYDVVLTSYGTLSSEAAAKDKQKRALMRINWFRIVLDEAHTIRNPSTANSKAACALHAQRRWAVTGTPVQNRLEDLGALIRFLRVKPFDEPQVWAQFITAPFKTGSAQVLDILRLLVDSITLRRKKDTIGMVQRSESIVRLEFSPEERSLYAAFAAQSNIKVQSLVRENRGLRGKAYAHVLKALLRLRMVCDHGKEMLTEDDMEEIKGYDETNAIDLGDEPGLETHSFITDKHAYEVLTMQHDGDMDQCARCGKRIINQSSNASEIGDETDQSEDDEAEETDLLGYLNPCLHLLHPACQQKHLDAVRPQLRADGYHECPYCEAYIRNEFFTLSEEGLRAYKDEKAKSLKIRKKANFNPDTYTPHTKVKALLQELQLSAQQSAQLPTGEPPIRSVVFTEWTTYLDLIQIGLDHASISYVRLDGSMSLRARNEVLTRFKTDPDITVLIVSIKAGGQGLNFTAANKVYLMEPQFNPGVEQQAVDRVHRLGQTRAVEITHFIMSDSVEEGLLKLQDKKVKLANLSLEKKRTGKEEASSKIQELRELFK